MTQSRTDAPKGANPAASAEGGGQSLAQAVARRRNFAIISHPDAGKTTLTEKLLLYGGAIQQAGAVKAIPKTPKPRVLGVFGEMDRGVIIK